MNDLKYSRLESNIIILDVETFRPTSDKKQRDKCFVGKTEDIRSQQRAAMPTRESYLASEIIASKALFP